jgi:glutathione synthase/RimK-type ligase-like ATP-grasp enzyme
VPQSVDQVLLVQDYVPARGGSITRIETLGSHFLYAIEVESGGDNFDLCPADACIAQPGRAAIRMTAVMPQRDIIESAERIARAVGLDVGGVEVVIDDRDGTPRFYDINAMSNFVADPLNVLGWDPHDRLIDFIQALTKDRMVA